MMPDETPAERDYYDARLDVILSKLDAINETIGKWKVECATRHAHDLDVMHLINGNGKPSLSVRLDRLEMKEPARDKTIGFWLSLSAIIAAVGTAIAEWIRR